MSSHVKQRRARDAFPTPVDDKTSTSSLHERSRGGSRMLAIRSAYYKDVANSDDSFLHRLSSESPPEKMAISSPPPLPTGKPVRPGVRKDDLAEQLTGTSFSYIPWVKNDLASSY